MRTYAKRPTINLTHYLDAAESTIEDFLATTTSPEEGFVTWQDMVSLARFHGVTCVVKRPLSLSGLSVPVGSQWAIIVRKGEPPERQRFTLAHEIAHLFVNEEVKEQVWQKTPIGAIDAARQVFEKFCDDLASRILMPRSMLAKDLIGNELSPSLLVDLAWKYGVSLWAFSIRAVTMQKGAYNVAEWVKATNSQYPLQRRWRVASRGMGGLMPEVTSLHSPVGSLFNDCLQSDNAEYGGEVISATKAVPVRIQASLLRRNPRAAVLTVAQRLKASQHKSLETLAGIAR